VLRWTPGGPLSPRERNHEATRPSGFRTVTAHRSLKPPSLHPFALFPIRKSVRENRTRSVRDPIREEITHQAP